LVAGAVGEFGRSRELFPGSFGFALTATASSVGAVALLFWAAGQIDRWSARIDAERQQAEDAHRQLMAVLEISADAILQVDDQGLILRANEGVERLFEHPREGLVGAEFEILIPERFRGRHAEYFRRLSEGPDGFRINLGDRMLGLARDGREVAIETTIAKTTVGGVPHLTVGIRDRTAAVQAEDALRQAALTDALTRTGNRRGFEVVAERVFDAAASEGTHPAVLVVDIDHFKLINDNHGHPAGDAVLQQFAAVCGAGLRARDRLFRIGGEEFALVLDGSDSEVAAQVAERLRGGLGGHAGPSGPGALWGKGGGAQPGPVRGLRGSYTYPGT
jgi:PAS domain S-box-containing protein